ncbi:MAG: hypothetical protein HN348_17095, partial [Proteobacteria bacterium]|nr:hypothetical protein [Pseudomonadota bacterium]
KDYNSFRQQAPGSFGATAAPNLYPMAEPPCQWGCGDIYVWVSVGNEGEFVSTSPDIEVTLYGVKSNGKHILLDSQPVGEYVDPETHSAGLEFVLSGWDVYDHLVAVVDDPAVFGGDGLAKECDETDNEVEISLDYLCP